MPVYDESAESTFCRRAQNKPDLFQSPWKRSGSHLSCSVNCVSGEVSRGCGPRCGPSALATGSIAGPRTTTRVGICGGQHAQQGRATARAIRSEHRDEPGRRPRPIQTHHAKVRFSWNSIRSSDKTPTRRNATQIRGPRSTIPLGQEEPKFLPARPSWHRSAH